MEGNAGQCLGQLPHCLLLWAELTFTKVLEGEGMGEDPPFCRLVSQAGQPLKGSGVDGWGSNNLPAQQGSQKINTLRETNTLDYQGLDQILAVTLNVQHFLRAVSP